MTEFDYTEAELRDDIRKHREFYDKIPDPGTDFVGWIAFKLGCRTRREAEAAIKWSTHGQTSQITKGT
jgi:primase-polymerase (primpol)-like protein